MNQLKFPGQKVEASFLSAEHDSLSYGFQTSSGEEKRNHIIDETRTTVRSNWNFYGPYMGRTKHEIGLHMVRVIQFATVLLHPVIENRKGYE